MKDRDLLERAARAAGIAVPTTNTPWFGIDERGIYTDSSQDGTRPVWWNPLTDDGDSARLRRALRIVVQWFPTDVAAMHWNADGHGRSWAEKYGDDPAAAERLAIVRAAAALADKATS